MCPFDGKKEGTCASLKKVKHDYIFILGLSSHVEQRAVVVVILVELLQITDETIKIVKKACVISLGTL